MKNLVFILLLTISVTVYCQTETPKDSLPPLKKEVLQLDTDLDNLFGSGTKNSNNLSVSNRALYQPIQQEELKAMDMNLPPIEFYVGPSPEANIFSRNPFVNDYAYYGGYMILDNASISVSSTRNTHLTLGGAATVGAQFNYQPFEWMRISAGPYGSKYDLYGRHYNDVGAGGAVKFILHDRIRLNGYGQYSVNGKRNGVNAPASMNMYPQTYYGGTVEVKITEKFGIEGGMMRELNPFNGKWENRPYIAPVFYSK